jgi:hypothetical protein
VVERAGLRFWHFPLTDYAAPSPDEVGGALARLETAARVAPAVYVHCRAGAGRAGLVTGAWMIAHGQSGDEAAALYVRFMENVGHRQGLVGEQWAAFYKRVGQPQSWWALGQIAAALGSPVTLEPPGMLQPAAPAGAEGWEVGYQIVLEPWKNRAREAQ